MQRRTVESTVDALLKGKGSKRIIVSPEDFKSIYYVAGATTVGQNYGPSISWACDFFENREILASDIDVGEETLKKLKEFLGKHPGHQGFKKPQIEKLCEQLKSPEEAVQTIVDRIGWAIRGAQRGLSTSAKGAVNNVLGTTLDVVCIRYLPEKYRNENMYLAQQKISHRLIQSFYYKKLTQRTAADQTHPEQGIIQVNYPSQNAVIIVDDIIDSALLVNTNNELNEEILSECIDISKISTRKRQREEDETNEHERQNSFPANEQSLDNDKGKEKESDQDLQVPLFLKRRRTALSLEETQQLKQEIGSLTLKIEDINTKIKIKNTQAIALAEKLKTCRMGHPAWNFLLNKFNLANEKLNEYEITLQIFSANKSELLNKSKLQANDEGMAVDAQKIQQVSNEIFYEALRQENSWLILRIIEEKALANPRDVIDFLTAELERINKNLQVHEREYLAIALKTQKKEAVMHKNPERISALCQQGFFTKLEDRRKKWDEKFEVKKRAHYAEILEKLQEVYPRRTF